MGITFTTDEERWINFEKANLDELRDAGESRTAFILRYTFAHPKISTVIVGAVNPDHLKELTNENLIAFKYCNKKGETALIILVKTGQAKKTRS